MHNLKKKWDLITHLYKKLKKNGLNNESKLVFFPK